MKGLSKRLFIVLAAFAIAFSCSMITTTPTNAATTKKYLGKFTITAYCGCKKCCGKYAGGRTATGTKPKAGRTIAVDPKKIKLKSKVSINGHTYTAEDTGGAIKGKKIDMYFSSHKKALQFGRKTLAVYKVVKTKKKKSGSNDNSANESIEIEVNTSTESMDLDGIDINNDTTTTENE